jgi:hypothetical protein
MKMKRSAAPVLLAQVLVPLQVDLARAVEESVCLHWPKTYGLQQKC